MSTQRFTEKVIATIGGSGCKFTLAEYNRVTELAAKTIAAMLTSK